MKLEQAARQALEALEQVRVLGSHRYPEAITALRKALAEQAEQDLDTCPGCGGVADNGHDREFPPNPYYCTNCTEQAEQEPVAWIDNKTWCFTYSQYEYEDLDDDMTDDLVPLYAAPVRTKDLTDDEIFECLSDCDCLQSLKFARAVIAADREKNRGAA